MAKEVTPLLDFSAFYRATLAPLNRYLSRIVGSHADAEDLAQDAYVRIYSTMTERELSEPHAYLYTTARNLALNRVKRQKLGPQSFEGALQIETIAADEPGVAHQVMVRQEWNQFEQALAALPPRSRSVLILRKVEGLSHEEIAQKLGISRSTVEKQLARAVRLLRQSSQRVAESPREDTAVLGIFGINE